MYFRSVLPVFKSHSTLQKTIFQWFFYYFVSLIITSGTLVTRLSIYLSDKVLLLIVLFQQSVQWYHPTAACIGCPSKKYFSDFPDFLKNIVMSGHFHDSLTTRHFQRHHDCFCLCIAEITAHLLYFSLLTVYKPYYQFSFLQKNKRSPL